jgi:TM2 domain-containing membrane protein YozV
MDAQKVDMFFMSNAKFFAPEAIPGLKLQVEKLSDDKFIALQSAGLKDPTTILIVAILAGGLAIDRFMLGQVGMGILKIITLGGFGIWQIVDMFTAQSRAREYNMQQIQKTLAMVG